MNVRLFGKRVLADIIKDLERRSPWIILVGLNSNDKCPETHRVDTEEKVM